MATQPAIHIKNLSFSWNKDSTFAIDNFSINQGEKIFLRGESGSGKSTLLNLISGVLRAQSGELWVLQENLSILSSSKRDALRAKKMGIIFQQFNLVPFLSLKENIDLRASFQKKQLLSRTELKTKMEKLGLAPSLMDIPVRELSVGQQQRVAALRAFCGQPELILADEPSSSLDFRNTDAFMNMLVEESRGRTVLFVSHDDRLAKYFDRSIDISEIARWDHQSKENSAR